MNFKYLSKTFQAQTEHIDEALFDKNRGYGVVTITVNNLTFGIPLRTKITHKNGLITDQIIRDGELCNRGLDYQKALLIENEASDLTGAFKIKSAEQRKKLYESEYKIKTNFERYVNKYIKAVENGNDRALEGYIFSTLKNYHVQLDIKPKPKPTVTIKKKRTIEVPK